MVKEKVTVQAEKQMAGLKRKIKNESDSRKEAIKRALRLGKDKFTADEILKIDNEVRAEFGMPLLKAYPLNLREYKPTTGEEFWQKFMGIDVIREKGKLPQAVELYEEAEGVSQAIGMERVEEEAKELYHQLYPQAMEINEKDLASCRKSVIQRHEMRLAGIDSTKTSNKDVGEDGPGKEA